MDIQTVISVNRTSQQRARELNTRAGENVFPVFDNALIREMLAKLLPNVTSLKEITSPEAILFPALDEDLVSLVENENPESLELLGKLLKVEYRDGYAPRITLDRETVSAHGWRELPDAGVRLPGGRVVEVVVSFGYYDKFTDQNIPELKSRCASRANKSLWDNWSSEGRPAIALPDPTDPTSVVPEIIECQYGVSVVDGTPLVGFGSVAVKSYRYYASDPWFEGKWFQTHAEADDARSNSVAKLESIRKEAIEEKQLKDAREAAEAARESLRSIQSQQDWRTLDEAIRLRVDNRRYASLPSKLDELQTWSQETEALVHEAEALLTEIARTKAERTAAFGPLLENVRGDTDLAERIDAFVRDCIKLRGASETARLLREEANCNYGRARRRDSISGHFAGVDHQGLDWAAGCDIHPAADWAEYLAQQAVPVVKKVPTKQIPVTTSPLATTASLDALRAKFGGSKKR